MSRTRNHKRAGWYGPKKAFRKATARANRAYERVTLYLISIDLENYYNILWKDYNRNAEWWDYD